MRERAAAEEEELRKRWVAEMEEKERLEQMSDAKRRMKKLVSDAAYKESQAYFAKGFENALF